jgi:hypothetical protein
VKLSDKAHVALAERAETELKAELEIIGLLKRLPRESAIRVMEASRALCEADALCPGVLATYLKGAGVADPAIQSHQRLQDSPKGAQGGKP